MYVLEWHGYLDLDDDEDPPAEVLAGLAALAASGCSLCQVNGRELARHYLSVKSAEYQQSLPVWACDCGAVYKVLTVYGSIGQYWTVTDEGTLGELAGEVRHDSDGNVRPGSASCRCARRFSAVIADRTNPQQPLF